MTETQQQTPAFKAGEIHKAIVEVMKEVGAVAKGKTSDSSAGSYKYRGIDDIYNAVNPAFAHQGIFTTNEILKAEHVAIVTGSGKSATECRLTTRWYFWASDGSWVSIDTEGVGRDTQDKAANKAMAAAHKYALVQILALPTAEPKDSEDPEIDITAEERRRQQQRPAPAPARPATPAPQPQHAAPPAKASPAPATPAAPAAPAAPRPAAAESAQLAATEIQALADMLSGADGAQQLADAWASVMAQQKKIGHADMKKLRDIWIARSTPAPAASK